MTQFVTRCPKCSTSFRITQAQMDRAKGAVRCGSCLQIFRAADHLISDAKPQAPKPQAAKPQAAKPQAVKAQAAKQTPAQQPAAEKPAAASPAPKQAAKAAPAKAAPKAATPAAKPAAAKAASSAPAQKGLQFNQQAIDDEAEWDDDQLIHDDLFDEEDSKDRTGELSDSFFDIYEPRKASQPEKSIFDREIKPVEDDEDTERADESWALSILEEVEDETRQSAKKEEAKAKSDYSRATTGTFSAVTDADLEAALEDNFNITGEQAALDEASFDSAPYDHDEPVAQEKRPMFQFADDEEERHEPLFTAMEEVDDEPALRAYDPERRAALRAIEPEPLEFGFHVESSPWPKRIMWASLCMAAAVTFIVQLGAYNMDVWARAQATRPYYEALCPLLGCQLPSLSDPSQVHASNLVVRSHPSMSDALQIDAVLLNKARFTQPFPLLELQFSDLQGKVVAARQFRPKEYLGGELAGQTDMPSNQPVHIALEILDPGPEAVNYTARIVRD
ncbi:DUF3426 domain-containing protein [Simiduia sp. 21SJ11W-1]|uniref:zinc-ribbon and DUF3426 domain-containing protein n=1 Tax=Simiduia sp. 21SJ11W-1 TaxID=2909669 RepID=UPI0020A06426|nr:DUF3426 domain-containing protein [Simiduia sp. 21SJ11W-1]UTA48626.1 DUF3426 domain-containing protein [Simiduia sp. 21SJ11W-1]